MGQELLKVFAAHECVYAADVDGVRETGAPQVVLDFSSPKALPVTIGVCERFKAACVVGTTALGDGDLAALRDLATRVPVVQSFISRRGHDPEDDASLDRRRSCGWTEIVETPTTKKGRPVGTPILLEGGRRDCPTTRCAWAVPGDHSSLRNDASSSNCRNRAISARLRLGALRAAEFAHRRSRVLHLRGVIESERVEQLGRRTAAGVTPRDHPVHQDSKSARPSRLRLRKLQGADWGRRYVGGNGRLLTETWPMSCADEHRDRIERRRRVSRELGLPLVDLTQFEADRTGRDHRDRVSSKGASQDGRRDQPRRGRRQRP
jgi:4-hydroxy-tetrahydrodipicolinate reductase